LLKAECGWWVNVGGASAEVVPKGIFVKAQAAVGGYARGCVPNPDPKHWGEWMCIGLGVALRVVPDFLVKAYFTFNTDGVYLRLVLLSTGVSVTIDGAPGWLNDLLGWITSMLTQPLFAAISLLIAAFRVRIIEYPRYLPGTALEWEPRLNTTPENAGPYLVFTADPIIK
jgi:hypothetical protein